MQLPVFFKGEKGISLKQEEENEEEEEDSVSDATNLKKS